MIILGIDPGSLVCGYGVIESNNNKLQLIEYGVIKVAQKEEDFNLRLKEIYLRIDSVIKRCKPDESSFETIFYGKNVQSMMKLSHARAVAILAATLNNIPINEYAPREIKKSVTGLGSASKEQVRFMVKKILNISENHNFFDATDALATAICHYFRKNSGNKKTSSWEQYIKSNPEKIKIFQ
ncbi:crossover junction endodeoxyribonuclease RuvC [Candidatus Kapaibacterium sp.]